MARTGSAPRWRMAAQAGLVVVVAGSLLAVAPSGPAAQAEVIPGDVAAETELVELRTRTSRTYEGEDGQRRVRVYPFPVNYSANGRDWKAIDNALVKSSAPGFMWENRANRYRVRLPGEASRPVRFELDDRWVEMRLDGAAGAGAADGSRAVFQDALGGVDVEYAAAPDGLKETLTLARPGGPERFEYAISASDGLTPQLRGNRVELDGA